MNNKEETPDNLTSSVKPGDQWEPIGGMPNGGIGGIPIPPIGGGGPKPPPPIPGICGAGKARGSNCAYIFYKQPENDQSAKY